MNKEENIETFSPLEICTEAENTLLAEIADGLRQALPNVESWARSCADCEECLPKCPQQIRIPNQMARIVELLRKR